MVQFVKLVFLIVIELANPAIAPPVILIKVESLITNNPPVEIPPPSKVEFTMEIGPLLLAPEPMAGTL